jgi:hypothetical protein
MRCLTAGATMRLISLVILFLATTAFAQSKDLAYFCVGEAAGGLWYNQQTKKWEGHSSIPSQKFVLKIKFPDARVRKGASEKQASDYNITITKTGENTGLPCRGYDANETVTVSDLYGIFISCITSGNEYQFSLGTRRFLSIYRYGYTNGKDNNDDNPSVEAGTCTKID